jgi:hypothetical protein
MAKKLPWGIVGGYSGMIVGFVLGGVYGTNYFRDNLPNTMFLGYRGSEAGAWIGGISGAFLGTLLGIILALVILNQLEKKD